LRFGGGIVGFGRREASVAIAAGSACLAEVIEQPHAATAGGLAQAEQSIELGRTDAFVIVCGIRDLDQAPLLDDIGQAVRHPCIRRSAVASGASGFLVIGLDALRQVEMGDEAHIRLVDAHAERDGRDHDQALFALKSRLVLAPRRVVHAGVIGQGVDALGAEPRRGLVDLAPRQAVDDAGLARMLVGDEPQQLRTAIVLVDDRVADVGAIEARHEDACRREIEARHNLGAGLRIGGRRQRDSRHARITLMQHRQRQVLGSEIVAPLRHAVRLVDREQRDLDTIDQVEATRHSQPLRRDVQEVELAGDQRTLGRARGLGALGRIEECGAHAQLQQGSDLVLHQRNQRRDDDARPRPHQRRDLIAERLPPAGRHQHQRVAAADDVVDDFALAGAEARVAEGLAQQLARRADIRDAPIVDACLVAHQQRDCSDILSVGCDCSRWCRDQMQRFG
jgi:hypothetical protein